MKAQHPDAKFVVWLGDTPAHDVYNQTEAGHKTVIRKLTNKLLEKYHGVGSLYPILGNHEGMPCDHIDVATQPQPEHWMFHFVADLWSSWLTPESQESMRKYGRYTQMHPNSNLRIVALNSFVQDSTNSYNWINMTDPLGEIVWLEEVLGRSETRGEDVLIIGHFPPSTSFGAMGKLCALTNQRIEWSKRYLVLVDRYANIIRGQLFGHTHQDSFQVERSLRPGEVAGVAIEHSSITPNFQLNPAYRVYEMDPVTHALIDYTQYRLNLTAANALDRPEWNFTYRFTEYYGVPDLEPHTYAWLAEKVYV